MKQRYGRVHASLPFRVGSSPPKPTQCSRNTWTRKNDRAQHRYDNSSVEADGPIFSWTPTITVREVAKAIGNHRVPDTHDQPTEKNQENAKS
jgi:hypothetical protein